MDDHFQIAAMVIEHDVNIATGSIFQAHFKVQKLSKISIANFQRISRGSLEPSDRSRCWASRLLGNPTTMVTIHPLLENSRSTSLKKLG